MTEREFLTTANLRHVAELAGCPIEVVQAARRRGALPRKGPYAAALRRAMDLLGAGPDAPARTPLENLRVEKAAAARIAREEAEVRLAERRGELVSRAAVADASGRLGIAVRDGLAALKREHYRLCHNCRDGYLDEIDERAREIVDACGAILEGLAGE